MTAKNKSWGRQKSEEARAAAVAAVLEAMGRDGVCFAPKWDPTALSAYNVVTGRRYSGANRLLLAAKAQQMGRKDPRWVTKAQLFALAGLPGNEWSWKGQRFSHVEHWRVINVYEKDVDGRFVFDETGGKEVVGTRLVFDGVWQVMNLAQVQGAPAWAGANDERNGFEKADRLIEMSRCKVIETASERAFYNPSADCITMPLRSAFAMPEGFASVLAHEMTHSTAPELGRKAEGPFGSPEYAFEELVAELGSAMVCAELGIEQPDDPSHAESHAAYLSSWLHAVRDDNGTALFKAQTKASAACDYIVARYGRPDLPLVDGAEEAVRAITDRVGSRKQGRRSGKTA